MPKQAAHCAVANCNTKYDGRISFFRFPKDDQQRCNEWLVSCGKANLLGNNSEYYHRKFRVCAKHFREDMFLNYEKNRLLRSAKPTYFLPTSGEIDTPKPIPSYSRVQDHLYCKMPELTKGQNTTTSQEIDNICRTCLLEKPNLKSLFDTDCTAGETLQLFQMLMACTTVQVEENDGLPPQICLSCLDCITRSFSFKQLCEQSDVTLREVLRKSTITDAEPLTELNSLSDVALSSPEALTRQWAEGETNIGDLTSDLIVSSTEYTGCAPVAMQNLEQVDSETVLLFLTTAYDYDTKTDDTKMEVIHNEIDLETDTSVIENEKIIYEIQEDETEQSIYPCEECTACFTVEDDLKIHADTHRTQPTGYKCKVCNKQFASRGTLRRHTALHAPKKYFCRECGRGFHRVGDVRTHLMTHTGERPHACKLCAKRFRRAFELSDHMRARHTNERNCICAECGKGFFTPTHLEAHQRKHTGIKRCPCSICGKKLANERSLAWHVKTHTGEKDHVCPFCGKRFLLIANLRRHELMHTGDRPYKCDECNKGFVSVSLMRDHKRIHTGEKPYQCHLCPKRCARLCYLKLHLRRHNGEQSHKCAQCEKAFFAFSDLRIHMRTHTGEKPYTCTTCGKSFAQSSSLKGHLKTHLKRSKTEAC